MEEETSSVRLTMDISKYPSIYIMATTFLVIILIFLLHMKNFKHLFTTCYQRNTSLSSPGDLSRHADVSISEPTLLTPEEVRSNIPRFSEFFREEVNSSDEELEDDVFETIVLDTLTPRAHEQNVCCTFSGSKRGKKTDSITESTDDIIFDNSMAAGSSGMH